MGPQGNSDTTGGHGTHVTGIASGSGAASTGDYPLAEAAPGIRGTFTGAAPESGIVAYGSGETLVILAATEAFQHILDNHDPGDPNRIRVINNSWGDGPGSQYSPGSVLSCQIKALVNRGVALVFAAGNSGGNGTADRTSSYCKNPTPGVICVASYNDVGTGAIDKSLSGFSSQGKQGRPAKYPDIAAPGDLITSTCIQPEPGQAVCADGETRWQPYYGTISGTSMASPHVVGALALLFQARPDLTPAQAEAVLQNTARKVATNGAYEPDPQNPGGTVNFGFGAGLLNLPAALDALGVTKAGQPPAGTESVIFDGDADGAVADGAADVIKLTVQEASPGVS
ncbi:MAG: S8 family serine peptidase, partial [Dongiaceae bacterium]